MRLVLTTHLVLVVINVLVLVVVHVLVLVLIDHIGGVFTCDAWLRPGPIMLCARLDTEIV